MDFLCRLNSKNIAQSNGCKRLGNQNILMMFDRCMEHLYGCILSKKHPYMHTKVFILTFSYIIEAAGLFILNASYLLDQIHLFPSNGDKIRSLNRWYGYGSSSGSPMKALYQVNLIWIFFFVGFNATVSTAPVLFHNKGMFLIGLFCIYWFNPIQSVS